MSDDQLTFVRHGRLWHADQQTIDVLCAIEKWHREPEVSATTSEYFFTVGVMTGRIQDGPAQSQSVQQKREQGNHYGL